MLLKPTNKTASKAFIGVSVAASIFTGVYSANAADIGFECKIDDGNYVTNTLLKGNEKTFITWKSSYFIGSGYSDSERCQQVTGRLNALLGGGTKLITHGTINNLPVICTTDVEGGECSDLLYTLKPAQDAGSVLEEILEFDAASVDGEGGLEESSKSCPLYIGFDRKGEVIGSRACEPKREGLVQRMLNSISEVF